uniref:L-asparaginase N-terminal domain-containing protein n=1 Tax=Timema tahoe TaxID=61484 RepID=A0A7R9P065_9NEOP|nr:unnamed protein product [Timema tahoe]
MENGEERHVSPLFQSTYDYYEGFVILHGTDTLAYTASALSFMLENLAKSVIVTGAQASADVPIHTATKRPRTFLMPTNYCSVGDHVLFKTPMRMLSPKRPRGRPTDRSESDLKTSVPRTPWSFRDTVDAIQTIVNYENQSVEIKCYANLLRPLGHQPNAGTELAVLISMSMYESRSDGREHLVNALILAGNYTIPEVTVLFGGKLMRGNRTTKVSSTKFAAFDSLDLAPLVDIGINIDVDYSTVLPTPLSERFSVQTQLNPNVAILTIFPSITTETRVAHSSESTPVIGWASELVWSLRAEAHPDPKSGPTTVPHRAWECINALLSAEINTQEQSQLAMLTSSKLHAMAHDIAIS